MSPTVADPTATLRRPGKWSALWHSLGQTLLGVPLVLVIAFWVVGLVLTPFGVGLVLLRFMANAQLGLANVYLRIDASAVGQSLGQVQLPIDHDLSPVAQTRNWLRDNRYWRLVGWTWAALPGLLLSAAPVLLLIAPLPLMITALALWLPGTMSLGWFLICLLIAVLCGWVSLRFGPDLLILRARMDTALLFDDRRELAQRVQDLTESRAQSVDHSAAELRRIERDLHDGAQVRLVALAMQLGMASDAVERDPEAARRLLAQARDVTGKALQDVRDVVRGIMPPVLADRGLVGGVEALALALPFPVQTEIQLDGRPPLPVESAMYFAIAECLTNAAKHGGASHAQLWLRHDGGALECVIRDDGAGGATLRDGGGLSGIERRLSAFDGTLTLDSPSGGPTTIWMEVPCALSSPRTTPS